LTAHLYFPKGGPDGKRPGVVALHPTNREIGKDVIADLGPLPNRGYAVELARRGYVVIAPDYVNMGEYKFDWRAGGYLSATMKGILNHMRCVDLLRSLDAVDGERIGAIGHSLGGHNAMFLGVFDARVGVIVSSCGWTPFHDYYGGDIQGWTHDGYMPLLATKYKLDPDLVPFDFYEVVAALAPRPFFSNSPISDSNFDYRGVEKAVRNARAIYALFDAADKLQVRYPECEHDFPDAVREEAYEFIDKTLGFTPVRKGF
jgi:pimeloyl-ACP methyl ester carboxylesterase